MTDNINQNPEQIARDIIDRMLSDAEWTVQSKNKVDLSASQGVAVREYLTGVGPADYVLFIDRKPVGIIEAKREEEGHRLTAVEDQSKDYANAKLKYLNNDPLPFTYESTWTVTRFTDFRDPKPRGRNVFSFHKPSTIEEWLKKEKSLRGYLQDLPTLDPTGLRPAQITAIRNLEKSFKNNRPKALIQMATGAGKTFTAATFIYRLLKFSDAKRILFLVNTKNLGEQAEQEFMSFKPTDDNRKFTDLYNVQRLSSGYISNDSQVCISTIQRLYSILKGEELDESAELDNPEENTWMQNQLNKKQPVPVEYSARVPIELFDFIVVDECHRSIYNLWKQVLDYFDAFIIGLTAKTDSRPLERKPTIALKDLLGAITMGVEEEDLFLSLANRLIRLQNQITEKEKEKLLEYSCGKSLKQNAGQHNCFTQEQMDWLRMIKDHVVSSYHTEIEDLDYTPFDALGGRGKMYQLFGNEMNEIIKELNEVLAA